MSLKRVFTGVLFLFLILNLVSCAPAGVTETEYGFFSGIWHGLVITFSLIGSFFDSGIALYAETNNGFFYYTGWVIGIIISIPVELVLTFLIINIFAD